MCYVDMGREDCYESQNLLAMPKELFFPTILRQSFKAPITFACLKAWVPKKRYFSGW